MSELHFREEAPLSEQSYSSLRKLAVFMGGVALGGMIFAPHASTGQEFSTGLAATDFALAMFLDRYRRRWS